MLYNLDLFFRTFRLLLQLYINPNTAGSGKEGGNQKSKPPTTSTVSETVTTTTVTTTPSEPITIPSSLPVMKTNITDTNISNPTPLTPHEEVRVGWIYNLQNADLQQEMSKFNLPTDGTVDDLRKKLKHFLKFGSQESELREMGSEFKTTFDYEGKFVPHTQTGAASALGSHELYHDKTEIVRNEDNSIREILGLPPTLPFKDVQRHLTELVSQRTSNNSKKGNDTQPTSVLDSFNPSSVTQTQAAANHFLQVPMFKDGQSDRTPQHNLPTLAQVCNTIRKWNLRFDGERDPVSFLERLNELADSYEIDRNSLIKALPELLKGYALFWYRNNKDSWSSYEDFVTSFENQFLPPDYKRNLDQEIVRRTQGEGEPIRRFVVALTLLMKRRGGFSLYDMLNRLYTNMKPDYKLTVRREQVSSIEELIGLAEGYESFARAKKDYRPPPSPAQALLPDVAYNPRGSQSKTHIVDMLNITSKPDVTTNSPQSPRKNWSPRNGTGHHRERHTFPSASNQENAPQEVARPTFRHKEELTESPDVTCWNCGNQGHRFANCSLPKKIKCFNCKREGIRTVHCPCRQGNDKRGLE